MGGTSYYYSCQLSNTAVGALGVVGVRGFRLCEANFWGRTMTVVGVCNGEDGDEIASSSPSG